MTRQKKLKSAVRTRARRTGERYSAARAQILRKRDADPAPSSPKPSVPSPKKKSAAGSVSDEAVQRKTGKSLAYWFGVLDHFDATKAGHTKAARHLRDDHGVNAWYCQGITVAYERERGLRAENQLCDGSFSFSVSRVLPAELESVLRAVRTATKRKAWLSNVDPAAAATFNTTAAQRSKKAWTIVTADAARVRHRGESSAVELRLNLRSDGRTTAVVTLSKLSSARQVDELRPKWRSLMDELRTYLQP